ncbi:MAG: hypothetical protein A2X55_04975 [Nitrospirae bacterium GWB2_47_37]|nr:MAG: hypothetical protein A2X55_04975 [Nitrospirae bacterium GWB2_47_37]
MGKIDGKYKLAVLTSHPIQYQTPLFRILSEHPEIDLTVYFCDRFGTGREKYDAGFRMKIKWDIPLLEGYNYRFLRNFSLKPLSGFWGVINPSIIKELWNNSYDAIWIHGYADLSNWFAFLGAWISRTPIILRGESHLLNYRPAWKRIIKKIVLDMLFKRIDCFLSIGKLNTEYYKHYNVGEEKIFLTPYSVDNKFFMRKYKELIERKNDVKGKLGISSDTSVILYASKMMPRKRPMDLLKAYEKIHNKVNMALVFVGDGIERSTLEVYTKSQNLKNVYFVGFKNQTELPEFFVIADVFVLPSIDEPWGLIINEAMNFGLPVITTDQVGARYDLVRDGENGFVYPAGDIGRLAECLLKGLQDPYVKEKMVENSLKIISNWSYKEDIDGILQAVEYIKKSC